MYINRSFVYSDIFASSFLVWILFLIAVCRTSKTMLNKRRKNGGLVFVSMLLVEKFSIFTIEYDVCCGLIIYHLQLCWDMIPLYPPYWTFSINGCLICQRFFCICWDVHMIYILQFITLLYHIDWFMDIEQSLQPGTNSTLSWRIWSLECIIGFQLANILLFIFVSMFINDIDL